VRAPLLVTLPLLLTGRALLGITRASPERSTRPMVRARSRYALEAVGRP
jgi:hypothetical protein